ncbi:hypothetical protein AAAC51_34535 [Priestia megaterium]
MQGVADLEGSLEGKGADNIKSFISSTPIQPDSGKT